LLHGVLSRLLGLEPGPLTWVGQGRRAIDDEKKQRYSPRRPILNRNAVQGVLLQYDHHSMDEHDAAIRP
jgi:hypothetical protein